MEKPVQFLVILLLSLAALQGLGQQGPEVMEVESLIKKEVKAGNRTVDHPVHEEQIRNLTDLLLTLPQVADAENDLCGDHLAIYPGSATIYANIKTGADTTQFAFHFQLGETPRRKRWVRKLDEQKLIYLFRKTMNVDGILDQRKRCCQMATSFLHMPIILDSAVYQRNQLRQKEVCQQYKAMVPPTRIDSLIGTWTDSTGHNSLHISLKNPEKVLPIGLTRLSSLKINWIRNGRPEPPMITNDDPDLAFDFVQDTWQQPYAFLYRLITLSENRMTLEVVTKKGSTSYLNSDVEGEQRQLHTLYKAAAD